MTIERETKTKTSQGERQIHRHRQRQKQIQRQGQGQGQGRRQTDTDMHRLETRDNQILNQKSLTDKKSPITKRHGNINPSITYLMA